MGASDTYKKAFQYDWSRIEPSTAIIKAIAAVENVGIAEVETNVTLDDYVDIEALDTLITTDSDVRISISTEKYRVLIDENTVLINYDEEVPAVIP